MPALSTPDTIAGPLIASDLEAARQHATDNVVHLHRTVLLPHGCDGQGRHKTRRFGQQAEFAESMPTDHAPQAAEACTDIGADDCRQPFTRWGVALVMLPWVLGVIGWAVWTRWPLF